MHIGIDTHLFVKRLVSKKFTEEQAEEVVNIIKEVRQSDLDLLATKRDIKEHYYKTVIVLGSLITTATAILVGAIALLK